MSSDVVVGHDPTSVSQAQSTRRVLAMNRASESRQRAAFAAGELIEMVTRAFIRSAQRSGLTRTQWSALRYFSQAAAEARSIGAFARYHQVTPSSASQSIGHLRQSGFVNYETGDDARTSLVVLTDLGRARLAEDPLLKIVARLEVLPEKEFAMIVDGLVELTKLTEQGSDTECS